MLFQDQFGHVLGVVAHQDLRRCHVVTFFLGEHLEGPFASHVQSDAALFVAFAYGRTRKGLALDPGQHRSIFQWSFARDIVLRSLIDLDKQL